MSIIKNKKFNFAFDSDTCTNCEGYCCRGTSGYIWVNHKEIAGMAAHLKLNQIDFIGKYLIKLDNRYSLKEKMLEDEYACIFFEDRCTIYEVRPGQCRSYPFWDYYKERIEALKKECPGVIE